MNRMRRHHFVAIHAANAATIEHEPPLAERLQRFERVADRVAKEVADRDGHADPQQRADEVEQHELPVAQAERAGERGRDRRESGHELREHHRRGAEALEDRFGLAHARIRRQRDAAQRPQHPRAETAAGEIPERVGDDRGERADQHERQEPVFAQRQVRAGDDERRIGRDRHARLLGQHVREHEPQPVLLNQCDQLVHDGRSSSIRRRCRLRAAAARQFTLRGPFGYNLRPVGT